MSNRGINSKVITVLNPETDEELDVFVRYKWYHDPGRAYMPNGDPGYPSESELDIVDSYPNNDPNEPLPDWVDDSMLEDKLWEDGDVFEDDYEPDYE